MHAHHEEVRFALHYHNAEIHLYEHSIHKAPSLDYGSYSLQRVDMLHSCLISCKSLFEVFLTVPSKEFLSLSMLTLGTVGHALASLFKLSLLQIPGWDAKHVQQTLDISSLLDKLICRFDATFNPTTRQQMADSSYAASSFARKLRRVKTWLESNFTIAGDSLDNPSPGPILTAANLDMFDMGDPFCFFDDMSWEQMAGADIML
jgi:hypothetical protein